MQRHSERETSDRRPAIEPAPPREHDDARDPTGRRESATIILVINCGSSSLKYSLYDTRDGSLQFEAGGVVECIGTAGTRLAHRGREHQVDRDLPKRGFGEAFKAVTYEVMSETARWPETEAVGAVAHRVVHGGERFRKATLVTNDVLQEIEALTPLALLHNPVNLAGIREMRRLFPEASHIAVFDTAFHHSLPPRAYLYGLPYEFYEKKHVRRYGFHGTSHHYTSLRAAEFLQRPAGELRLITCHLGNGSSLCAVDHGRSADTTMGFTPAEGLIMGTRCGDIDAGVLAFLERTDGLSAGASEELLNQRSGLLGLSGISGDMREILRAAAGNHPRAQLALDAYCYRIRKYIGAYIAAMGGLDAIAFTGGIGQGSAEVRSRVLQGLSAMGITLDESRNRAANGFERIDRISTDASPIALLVVPADEERMMAREAIAVWEARAQTAKQRGPAAELARHETIASGEPAT
jgi:acetate kinase